MLLGGENDLAPDRKCSGSSHCQAWPQQAQWAGNALEDSVFWDGQVWHGFSCSVVTKEEEWGCRCPVTYVTTFLSFFAQVLNAAKEPSVVPQELVMMLIHGQPDWTSRNWRSQYTSTFQKVLPAQHSIRIKQGRLVTWLSARRHPFHCYQCVKDTCVRLWHTWLKRALNFVP